MAKKRKKSVPKPEMGEVSFTHTLILFLMVFCHQPYSEILEMPLDLVLNLLKTAGVTLRYIMDLTSGGMKSKSKPKSIQDTVAVVIEKYGYGESWVTSGKTVKRSNEL